MSPTEIKLSNGNKILLDSSFIYVYMLDEAGNKVWETKCNDIEFERSFTNPYLEKGHLWVGTTIGVEYQLDISTGAILKKIYRK